MIWNDKNLITVLKNGGVAVMPTDTIYGIVGKAFSEPTVSRIYTIRKRSPEKPCIILIGDEGELKNFSIILSEKQKQVLQNYWPGPVSIILDCVDDSLKYLHRGTSTLAFRLPSSLSLRELLVQVGPLIAPSANPEGILPTQNIDQAKKYFGDSVDFSLDGDTLSGKVSKLIKLHKDGSVVVLRE